MDIAILAVRISLALVFAVAGVSKFADRAGSQLALREFGVPDWLARPLGVLLPLVELGVAVALLPAVSAWWEAVGAAALLLLFVVGMTVTYCAVVARAVIASDSCTPPRSARRPWPGTWSWA
jgi:uncharacterized membrane protein YphA (DoxX/SURF4 family)